MGWGHVVATEPSAAPELDLAASTVALKPERRRALWVLVAALITAAATARLGVWQLDRAAQKTALQSAIEQRRTLPMLAAHELARDALSAPAQHHRSIRLRGRWLPQHTVYLDNRQMQGRPGFFVLTPLALPEGAALMVQRGWIPRDPRDRTLVLAPPLPEGEVIVEGRIAPPPSRLYEFETAASGPLRQNLDLESFASEIRLPLRPLSLLQAVPAEAQADGLQRDWPLPGADVHKHYGYAFQWFALSVLTLVLYVWFHIIRPRRLAQRAR